MSRVSVSVGGEQKRFGSGVFRMKPDGSALEFLHQFNNNTWGVGFNEDYVVAIGDRIALRMWGAYPYQDVQVVDPQGNVAKHYEKVDPDEHAAEVLADLAELGAGK